MTKLFIFLAMFVGLTTVSQAQMGPDYKAGQKIQTVLPLGEDGLLSSTKRSIPLPAGEWMVVRGYENKSTSNQPGNPSPITFGGVDMVQSNAGRITAMLFARANVAGRSTQWTDKFCTRTDLLHQNSYSSGVWDQRCLEVQHLVNFYVNPSNAAQVEIKAFLTKQGLTVPPVMIGMNYRQYDQQGNLMTYQYAVDPASMGIETADSSYSNSPWHKDKLDKDPVRAQFVKQFVDYSEKLSVHLEQVFLKKAPEQKDSSEKTAAQAAFTFQK